MGWFIAANWGGNVQTLQGWMPMPSTWQGTSTQASRGRFSIRTPWLSHVAAILYVCQYTTASMM
jgi:hypothetical protein